MNTPPALVLITTDGYVNAFTSNAGFLKAATDILALGRSEGWDYVEKHLSQWLEEASMQGSGDDVTVALLVPKNLVGGKAIPGLTTDQVFDQPHAGPSISPEGS